MQATSQSYRDNAEKLRAIAARLRGDDRQDLLNVANAYDRLADKVASVQPVSSRAFTWGK